MIQRPLLESSVDLVRRYLHQDSRLGLPTLHIPVDLIGLNVPLDNLARIFPNISIIDSRSTLNYHVI